MGGSRLGVDLRLGVYGRPVRVGGEIYEVVRRFDLLVKG